jgi:uncharacterized SAM-binding protein YcdF (DUF218 family)
MGKKDQKHFSRLKLAFLALLFIFLLAALSYRTVLTSAASFLIKEDPLKPAELLVVLGGDRYARAREAADIYKEGYIKEILYEDERELSKLGIAVERKHEISKKVLEKLGVPENVISFPKREAFNTYQEALIVKRFISKRKITSIIIVTSKTHMRRASMIYRFVLGRDVEVICRPTKYDSFRADRWWKRKKYIRNVVTEYIALFYYSLAFLKAKILG